MKRQRQHPQQQQQRQRQRHFAVVLLLCLFQCSLLVTAAASSDAVRQQQQRNEGRLSYSLTTFEPTGKLGQVERALQAAAKGPPILAVILPSFSSSSSSSDQQDDDTCTPTPTLMLFCPQVLPSVFVQDDGTRRFTLITPEIVVAHSGLSADGRMLVAAAQRLAVEHEYTYHEPIPLHVFLEELSLLFQEYTMKPAARPFGSMLLVAHLPSTTTTTHTQKPHFYRMDPSGSVISLGDQFAMLNGNKLFQQQSTLRAKIMDIVQRAQDERAAAEDGSESTLEDCCQSLAQLFKRELMEQQPAAARTFQSQQQEQQLDFTNTPSFHPLTILSATLSRADQTFRLHRY